MNLLQEKLASYRAPTNGHPATNGLALPSGASAGKQVWQKLIDEQLIEWCRSPEQFAEEGLKAPTPKAISAAHSFAQHCQDQETDPPLRVSPDGSGGIVFEWRVTPLFCMVEIGVDGQIEMLLFENSKLVGRLPIG